MKSFIKSFLATSASATLALGLATPASATCVSGCEVVVTTTNNTTPPPPQVDNFGFNAGGWSSFSGSGAAGFNGSTGVTGFAMAEKIGYGGTDTTLSAGGNLCGVSCQSGSFTFTGFAGEHVKASAGAIVTTPGGGTVGVANFGNASSGVGFNFQKVSQPAR